MKATDLMIGSITKQGVVTDIFLGDDDVYFVSTDKISDREIDYFDSIPLTEEWLIKLNVPQWFVAHIGGYSLDYFINTSLSQLGYLELKHVHQLQNLYFALTNEELTIKL